MAKPSELPTKRFASAADWERWLDEHHGDSAGVWLQLAKADAGIASVSYAEALEVAILFGWIDGQKQRLDDRFWLQKFTPRTARSPWSERNREIATRLIEGKRMRPAGLAAVDSAKADGRWARAYASPRNATVPPDLQRALDAAPAARAFFATIDGRNRFAILYRVQTAKKPETRAKRIADFVAMLAQHETLHPTRSPTSGRRARAPARSR